MANIHFLFFSITTYISNVLFYIYLLYFKYYQRFLFPFYDLIYGWEHHIQKTHIIFYAIYQSLNKPFFLLLVKVDSWTNRFRDYRQDQLHNYFFLIYAKQFLL